MKTRADIFKELTEKAADTYRRKNADYGDSFVKVRNKFPNSVLIRLNDKLNRLEMLMGNAKKAEVKDESIEDTLLDLANYALMELTERIYDKQNAEQSVSVCSTTACAMCGAEMPEGYGLVCPICEGGE